MKKWLSISTIIFLLSGLLLTYNQCVPGGEKSPLQFAGFDSSNQESNSQIFVGTGGAQNSVEAFAQTVHPITKQRCVSCHGSFQQPLHAVENAQQAHDAVIDASKVNFNNISSSRLAQKVAEGHNCWGDCTDNAQDIIDAIQDWYDSAYTGGTGGITLDGPTTYESQVLENVFGLNGNIMVNAESASLTAPMVTGETAGGINFIQVPNGQGTSGTPSAGATAGRGHILFDIPAAGIFKAFALVNAPSGGSDSAYFRVNNGSYSRWDIGTTTDFEWREITSWSLFGNSSFNFSMSTGTGVIEIQEREEGVQISKLLLTTDLNIQANQITDDGTRELSFNLNGLISGSGAILKMDIENFDAYSYKMSNIRIEVPTGKVYVKNIKILINGVYNPQHATYTVVDKEITSADPLVSDAALIALKDLGTSADKISINFETLQFYFY